MPTKTIPITSRSGVVGHATVDKVDYAYLMQWRWCFDKDSYPQRGQRGTPQRSIRMHQAVAERAGISGETIDHKNRDKCDNRRQNLRGATRLQQVLNTGGYGQSSHKGVSPHREKWRARIKIDGKQRHLGLFDSELEAAEAYQKANHRRGQV